MLKAVKLHLFDTGYCLNIEKMVAKNRPFQIKKFYALVGLIEHPEMGPILFDTGYSPRVVNVCKRLPYRLYSLLTPISTSPEMSASEKIKKWGYQPQDIRHVIISHFHPDHIGGLKDFNNAKFYFCKKTYSQLKNLSSFSRFRELFFTDLIPDDMEDRSEEITTNPIAIPFHPFDQGFDLFNDRSCIAIPLPGHAKGQFGILLRTNAQNILLAADSCWLSSNYQNLEFPHVFAKAAIHDYPLFCKILKDLHTLKQNNDIEIIPSHCDVMWKRYVLENKPC